MKAIDLLSETTGLPAVDVAASYNGSASGAGDVDQAVAVWFTWHDAQRCIPCDLYDAHGANLLAIAQLIQGCVAEHARGSIAAVDQALSTFTPTVRAAPPTPARAQWSKVLGLEHNPSPAEITGAFRRRAHEAHPDKGGTREQWDTLVSAMAQAQSSIRLQETLQPWDRSEDDESRIWAALFPEASPD